ncbi:hypothetical protein KP004_12030 [Geomonas oryzisoli]|uniref:UDP-3-O-(3-hydroxymyristoyl)glucosamine N-acyltransferase n=1 Tax=Geomonas oryzisoli TaxID=2847992 RepID=A0ABX8J136_9BACT|nr:DapH/DapD/GlmU-related protein [Geomonas oryzisoli]QWV91954.1 hypothetical protein KP004_12030 [Geomonas oryzisoli]
MYELKKFEVWASEIAGFLNRDLVGTDFILEGPRSLRIYQSGPARNVANPANILLLTSTPEERSPCHAYIVTDRPELDMGNVLREFFSTLTMNTVHPSAVVSDKARIGRNVMVGALSVIGPDVEIGDNTKILSNVVINGPATIGKQCVIKDGAVVGSEGWGFIDDEDGVPFHPPQLGRVIVGDQVWIGSNTTIERAIVEDTTVCANTKLDDLVHIGGGSYIGSKCMVTAGSVIAFNVVLGDNVTIAPNACIRENVTVHDDVTIGQGAVVVEDLSDPGVYVGNPARFLR